MKKIGSAFGLLIIGALAFACVFVMADAGAFQGVSRGIHEMVYGTCVEWQASHRPVDPGLFLSVDTRHGTNDVPIRAASSEDVTLSLYIDSQRVSNGGSVVEGSFTVSEGEHIVRATAKRTVWSERHAGCSVTSTSSREKTIVVDTTPPQFANLRVSLDDTHEQRVVVSGVVRDSGVGIDKLLLFGSRRISVEPGGSFEFKIFFKELDANLSLTMIVVDRLGNEGMQSLEFAIPANCWVLYTPDGKIVRIVATLGYSPFEQQMVGVFRYVWGWTPNPLSPDAYFWRQYVKGTPQTPIAEDPSNPWPQYRLWVAGGLGALLFLILVVIPMFFYLSIAGSAGKGMVKAFVGLLGTGQQANGGVNPSWREMPQYAGQFPQGLPTNRAVPLLTARVREAEQKAAQLERELQGRNVILRTFCRIFPKEGKVLLEFIDRAEENSKIFHK